KKGSEDDQASTHLLTKATGGAAPAGWIQGRAELSIYTHNGIGAGLAGRSGEPGLAMRQAPPSKGRLLTPQILRQFIDPDIEFGNRYFQLRLYFATLLAVPAVPEFGAQFFNVMFQRHLRLLEFCER
ncbi:hypothetical protein, partial [Rhizobium sp. BR 315]|uniref:hypothetical protein n=1 Tax=Rhizobium sp. BR 315 TaxID=3040014 RepID=UPI003D33B94C